MPTGSFIDVDIESPISAKHGRDPNLNNQVTLFKSGSTVVRILRIENVHGAVNVHGKFYNNATPTIGSTEPDLIVKAKAGCSIEAHCHEGLTLGTALAGACVVEPGNTGTTDPPAAVMAHAAYT